MNGQTILQNNLPGIIFENYQDHKVPWFQTLAGNTNKRKVAEPATGKSFKAGKPPPAVTLKEINNLPATPWQDQPSFTGTIVPGINLASNADQTFENTLDGNEVKLKAKFPRPGKSIPVECAEIMPQYRDVPGRFFPFLKNIHSSCSVEEGEEVRVQIEFAVIRVGISGILLFVKPGGEIFDNGVLRILKKCLYGFRGKVKGEEWISLLYRSHEVCLCILK